MSPAKFNEIGMSSWPLFTSVDKVRSKFSHGTAIMIAIGGWGDTKGFDVAARTQDSRQLFALNVRKMVDATGADGEANRCPISIRGLTNTRRRYRLGVPWVS